MSDQRSPLGQLAVALSDVIHTVDEQIGENRNYGEGIGPHDEDDQIDALVSEARRQSLLESEVYTVASNPSEVQYPGGQSADINIDRGGQPMYVEAKLFRFQKANGDPSSRGFSKVFSPYQKCQKRSFVSDVEKLAESDVRANRGFVGIYYRPLDGAGAEISSEEIAQKFSTDVNRWTDYSVTVDTVSSFSGLQHDVHARGGVLTWQLDTQPEQYF
jgi:hypothetical protein